MNEKKNYGEIDIMRIILACLKKWWIIVLSGIVGAVLVFAYTFSFVTPMYSASAMMYVNNTSSIGDAKIQLSASDLNVSKSLVDTYVVILKTRLNLEEVISVSGVDYSYTQLRSMVSASAVNDTEIFTISVSSPDPKEACLIANTIVEVLPKSISGIIEGTQARVVDYAVVPPAPYSPSMARNSVLGFVGAAAIACLIIAIIEIFDDTLEKQEWLTETFGEDIPVLAVIPDAGGTQKGKYGYYKRPYYSRHYYSRNYYSRRYYEKNYYSDSSNKSNGETK